MQNKKKILGKKFSHFIFDIDGVILNSKNNMRLSWIKTNNKGNLKKIDFCYNMGAGYKLNDHLFINIRQNF